MIMGPCAEQRPSSFTGSRSISLLNHCSARGFVTYSRTLSLLKSGCIMCGRRATVIKANDPFSSEINSGPWDILNQEVPLA